MPTSLPTPQDAGLLLQDTTTRTANFTSAALDLGPGFAPGGLGKPVAAVVHVTARDASSGNETYTLTLEESSDNAAFTPAGAAVTVTATGVIPLRGWLTKRYARVALVVGGTTPSITFKAWLNTLA